MIFNFIDSNIKTRCCYIQNDGILLSINYEEAWLHISELKALIEMIKEGEISQEPNEE